jgi:uncharacterized SAM-binding protein YcdF (DUF218 family)
MRKAGRYFVRLLAVIGFLYLLATVTPIDRWCLARLSGSSTDPPGEVLIIPRADAVRDVIGLSTYWRSVYAVRAWRAGGVRDIVVCGGSDNGEVSIAERMRDFLLSQGIPPPAVHVEASSRSTRENAINSKAILDQLGGRKVLLTSDYHMLRAYRTFRKAGFDVQPRPIPDAAKQISSWPNRWPVFMSLCVETSKLAYYFARGWI